MVVWRRQREGSVYTRLCMYVVVWRRQREGSVYTRLCMYVVVWRRQREGSVYTRLCMYVVVDSVRGLSSLHQTMYVCGSRQREGSV